ncbi:MAG: AAA family ATPase [Elusimicrobia bacterium]|nr:AAA family ATPase [Elusimicrobiota bacterium]
MNTATMHPMFLAMAMLGIGASFYGLHARAPELSPYLFAASALALAFRARAVLRENDDDPAGAIDFERLRRLDLSGRADRLKESLRGHDGIVDAAVAALRRNAGLAGSGRTLGAFMLAGPTGTGKTYLAELMARSLYPDSQPLILRMNQYKQPEDVYTLIGPPPGQPGYEIGGALTRPVLENPYRVVVLDEIDKCHPDVRDCLYNVLDAGECREKSSGRMVHFNACLFFATCNAGVEGLRALKQAPLDGSVLMGRMRDVLMKDGGFEKAFLARFDDIFFMDELAPIHVAEVSCLRLAAQWKQYGIEVTFASPELLLEAMRKNADFKEYGVRQLYRLIQDLTDASIQEARANGMHQVRLGIDGATGRIVIAGGTE